MKRASLLAAVALVLVANAFALFHAWRNRSGPVDTDIALTERELPLSYRSKDDTGVSLDLRWLNPSWVLYGWDRPAPWLDRRILLELGFDTSVSPSDKKADEFYLRQRARRAFIALEYEGAGWRNHLEETDRRNRESLAFPQLNTPPHSHEGETHLVAVDASDNAARLRARHPDRHSVIVVPCVVRVTVEPFTPAIAGRPARPAQLSGFIQELPSLIHVPRPFSDRFRQSSPANYRVHLLYGASHEPWIGAVDFASVK